MSLLNRITNAITGAEPSRETLTEKLTCAQAKAKESRAAHAQVALAAEEGDELSAKRLDKVRDDMEADEQRIRDLQQAILAHDERVALEAARLKAMTREQFETEGRAALTELGALAANADKHINALAETLGRWAEGVDKARPYLSEEGYQAVIRAQLYLRECVGHKLRAFRGFSSNPMLAAELDSWARHMPKPEEWQRLLSK